MSPQPVIVTDRSLVERMRRGDTMASRELRRRHIESLYALAYALLGDPEGSDAVVDAALAHASGHAREFDPMAGSVFEWLKSMVRTRCYSVAFHRIPEAAHSNQAGTAV